MTRALRVLHAANCEVAEGLSDFCTCGAEDDAAAVGRSRSHMTRQPALDLGSGRAVLPDRFPLRGEFGEGDPMPPGPFAIGLTHGEYGDGLPFTVICGDGRAVAGHVPSRKIAQAIVEALNAQRPNIKQPVATPAKGGKGRGG